MLAESPIGDSTTAHDGPRRDRSALDAPVQRAEDRSGPRAWTRRIDDDSHQSCRCRPRAPPAHKGRDEALKDDLLVKLPGEHQIQAQEMHTQQQEQGSGQQEGAAYSTCWQIRVPAHIDQRDEIFRSHLAFL